MWPACTAAMSSYQHLHAMTAIENSKAGRIHKLHVVENVNMEIKWSESVKWVREN